MHLEFGKTGKIHLRLQHGPQQNHGWLPSLSPLTRQQERLLCLQAARHARLLPQCQPEVECPEELAA